MLFQRRFEFENIVNCRDMGGYAAKGGAVTQFGRLFRCGMPRNPVPQDMEKIESLGIKTVIDLRGDVEATERPSVFLNRPDFDYKQISLLEVNPADSDYPALLKDIYKMSVDNYGENFAGAVRAIVSSRTPLMFHCFLGKDRTGMLAAFLLELAGVSREDIIADYQVSGTYLEPFYLGESKKNDGLIWEHDDDHLRSEPHNIVELFEYLEAKYGGVAGYLTCFGSTREEIERAAVVLL